MSTLEAPWDLEITGPFDRRLFLGIDPGMNGGLSIVDRCGIIVDATPMPDTERDIADYFKEFAPRIHMAHIEAVHSMPKQGIASAFKFGMGLGGLRMALVAFSIPFEAVTPQVWQRRIGTLLSGRTLTSGKTAKKNGTKARAQELFPGHKITHKIADSLLIAEDCRRITLHGKA